MTAPQPLWARLPGGGWVLALFVLLLGVGCERSVGPSAGGGRPPGGAGSAASPVVEVAAGAGHACARRSGGTVQCWGRNDFGQLGDGTTTDRAQPVSVLNLGDATALALGADHTCVLRKTGAVICWGRNDMGQLGNAEGGPKSPRGPRPVSVRNLVDATMLTAGAHHACAARKTGSLVCWGDNRRRQLGNQGRSAWVAPVGVEGVAGVQGLAAGEGHTCVRRHQGNVVCWGDDRQGQLGDGGNGSSATPRVAPGTEGATALTAGKNHTCAATATGVLCWGANAAGQVSGQSSDAQRRPMPIVVTGRVIQLAAGEAHTCARTTDGDVRCWGSNQDGRLGDGTTDTRKGPVTVGGLGTGVLDLGVGRSHSCALDHNRQVQCWGRNESGALGTGAPGSTQEQQGAALLVLGIDDATSVGNGLGFSCASRDDGVVQCWGANDKGQLGNDTRADSQRPVSVAGIRDAVSVAVGWSHACAVTRQGAVQCWGDNAKGQLGDGNKAPQRRRPVAVTGLRDAVEVAAGRAHTCARRKSGAVVCWGDNAQSQSGAAAGGERRSPTGIANLKDARQLAAGGDHSCALRASGSVACWGSNSYGQLGNGAGAKELGTPRPQPVTVAKLTDAAEIRLGDTSSCARRQTGQVACWGRNDVGQLGAGTQSDWSTRVPVKDVTSSVSLAMGPRQACAATSGGTLQCWGRDDIGQYGPAGRTLRTPAIVPGIRGVSRIATSATHSCGRLSDGRVMCWGDNSRGQLGDGGIDYEARPVAVRGL